MDAVSRCSPIDSVVDGPVPNLTGIGLLLPELLISRLVCLLLGLWLWCDCSLPMARLRLFVAWWGWLMTRPNDADGRFG